jgi:hydrogenase maturation factor
MLLKTRVETRSGSQLEIIMGFLPDRAGEMYCHISGRLTDETGKVMAMGHIPDVILNILEKDENFKGLHEKVKDFVISHGHNANGISMANIEKKSARESWERIQNWFPNEIARFSAHHTL